MRRSSLFCGGILPRARGIVKRFFRLFVYFSLHRTYWFLQQNFGKEVCVMKGNNQNNNQNKNNNTNENNQNQQNQNNQ